MKKILEYRKLYGVDKNVTLKDLKSLYRNFMKEWHPDKFINDAEAHTTAEHKSKAFIEAYHFLVSIAPETHTANLESYTATINKTIIVDFQYKAQTLRLDFSDGSSYEYFEVPQALYTKLVNAEARGRFARRHICGTYLYRNLTGAAEVAA